MQVRRVVPDVDLLARTRCRPTQYRRRSGEPPRRAARGAPRGRRRGRSRPSRAAPMRRRHPECDVGVLLVVGTRDEQHRHRQLAEPIPQWRLRALAEDPQLVGEAGDAAAASALVDSGEVAGQRREQRLREPAFEERVRRPRVRSPGRAARRTRGAPRAPLRPRCPATRSRARAAPRDRRLVRSRAAGTADRPSSSRRRSRAPPRAPIVAAVVSKSRPSGTSIATGVARRAAGARRPDPTTSPVCVKP